MHRVRHSALFPRESAGDLAAPHKAPHKAPAGRDPPHDAMVPNVFHVPGVPAATQIQPSDPAADGVML